MKIFKLMQKKTKKIIRKKHLSPLYNFILININSGLRVDFKNL